MIPIIFEKDEISFTNNGLGRLRDAISVVVTEERNGVYECTLQYPVTGANFDLIQIGRIIGVTHDDTGDVQPFDIVSSERPIDGIVTFHAVHISYRQSFMTVTGSNINSLAAAFNLLGNAEPSNPFNYWTDKASTGYLAAADGVPKSVRQILGGVEGSILDIYGGEYEWDKFTVKLWAARGQFRDFTIRYGVNLLDYNDEMDNAESYSSCVPYWTDGTTTIVGDRQDSGGATITGRGECVPLDVSDRFEDQPTNKAAVNAMGLAVLNEQQPYLPARNITVSFVRLQDLAEYENYGALLSCGLCDTIRVIFPGTNNSGTFKIVKTTWDVLAGRYEEMELGSLSTSLSEALGISDIQKDSKSTVEQIISEVEKLKGVTSYTYDQFTYNTGFTYYETTAGHTNTPAAYKNGRIVMLKGAYRASPAQSSSGQKTIGKVPAGCEPIAPFTAIQQGSSQARFHLTIDTNGDIKVDRYGTTSAGTIPNNAWLNIACTYIGANQ